VEERSRNLGPGSFAFAGQPKEKHASRETKYTVRGSRLKSATRRLASRIDTIRLGLSVILQNRKFNINNTQGCKSSEMVSVVIRSVVYDVSNNCSTFVLRVSLFFSDYLALRIKAQSSSKRRKLPTHRNVGLYSPVGCC
jgi:hypothetical protein